MAERLQKLIAEAGIASRRKAEEFIVAGRVKVNGEVVTALGSKAEPGRDTVTVDGKPVKAPSIGLYFLFYKPRGVVTTLSDPEGRPTIKEYIEGVRGRLFPVGRLDFNSEGLLILSNDGELANRILHASSALPKTYWAKVAGRPSQEQLEKLRQGVYIEGRKTAPAQIRWLSASGRERARAGVYRPSDDNPWLEVVLIEGRYHQIRKMFALIGHPVEKLKRVAIGGLRIGTLKPGHIRPLTPSEVSGLRAATRPGRGARTPRPAPWAKAPQRGGGRRQRELPAPEAKP